MALLESVRIRGYRSARDVKLGWPVTALVGEARSGKSSLLVAVRALLDPAAPPSPRGRPRPRTPTMTVEAKLAGGRTIDADRASAREAPGRAPPRRAAGPSSCRRRTGRGRCSSSTARSARSTRSRTPSGSFREAARESRRSTHSDSAGASALVSAVDAGREAGVTGVVFLIEEPELFLRPQAQRYLYRLLRTLASAGNQVIYSTHAPGVPQRRPPQGARPRR